MVPAYSSGVSIETHSYGVSFWPSTILVITRGRETWNSYPSRRNLSMNIAKWSSPLPDTIHPELARSSSTLKATSFSSSLYRRSLIWREVLYSPSLQERGEVLTEKVILIVGSSIESNGSA